MAETRSTKKETVGIRRFDWDANVPGHSAGEPSASQISPGDILGRYTVRAILGEGGMGQVFAAFDPELHRPVAMKVIPRRPNDTPSSSV